MGKAFGFWNGDVIFAQKIDHAADERGNQQRHVATGSVGGVYVLWQRLEAGSQAFQRAISFALILGDQNRGGQGRQFLVGSGDDNDWRDHFAKQPDDALQHSFWAEGEERFGSAHTGRFSATENDAADLHIYRGEVRFPRKC